MFAPNPQRRHGQRDRGHAQDDPSGDIVKKETQNRAQTGAARHDDLFAHDPFAHGSTLVPGRSCPQPWPGTQDAGANLRPLCHRAGGDLHHQAGIADQVGLALPAGGSFRHFTQRRGTFGHP